jgi:class 3 adenylate cyclase
MRAEAAEVGGQAVIMFTDLEAVPSARRDAQLAQAVREEQGQLVRGLLPCHGGREVKALEDGFLLEFDGELPAVSFGLALQAAWSARNQCVPAERRVALRIGIHRGPVVHHEGDVFGEGVNLAARLEALARPGTLYVSEAVARRVAARLATPPVRLGRGDLKKIRLPVEVYRIDPPGQQPLLARMRALF